LATRRPPNRKALISSAASGLFRERGYHNVSLADVAQSVGITAPALYRHYPSKQDLLLRAVLDGVDAVGALIGDSADLDEAIRALSALAVERPGVSVLWEREARHLDDAERDLVRRRGAAVVARLAALVRAARPDLAELDALLVALATLGVFSSRARRRASLPQRRFERLLYRLGTLAAHCELTAAERAGAPTATAPAAASALRLSRREELLVEAARLFDERGFQSVSLGEVGETVGIVGSGVYRYFPSKIDLLLAANTRGGERMRARVEEALADPGDPREVLQRLLGAHVAVTIEHAHLMSVLINERDQLPEKERGEVRRFLQDYMDIWLQVFDRARPGRDPAEARIVIATVQAMVFFVVRTLGPEPRRDLDERVTELGMKLLEEA
jgi:AcrR family transcriptional regulator